MGFRFFHEMTIHHTSSTYQKIYRNSKLGKALAMTLESFVARGCIQRSLAISILDQFDKSMYDALETHTNAKIILRGQIVEYRGCDNLWQYHMKNAKIKIVSGNNEINKEIYKLKVDKLIIICVNKKFINKIDNIT